MRVERYTPATRSAWDAFVTSHPHHGIGHLSATFELEAAAAGARNHSLVGVDDTGRLCAALPLFLAEHTQLRAFTHRVLASGTQHGAGPLVDEGLAQKQRRALLTLLMDHAEREAHAAGAHEMAIGYPTVVAEQPAIDFYHYYPLKPFGYAERNVVSLLIDLRPDEERLRQNLHSDCRNKIRKCVKEGGEARLIDARERWLSGYDLNVQTLGALAYSRRTLEVMWDHFVAPGHAFAVGVYRGDDLVNISLFTHVNHASYYWCGFNSRQTTVPGANNLGLFEGILESQRRGATMFEVGSLEFSDPKQIAIGKFKESFGGVPAYVLSGTKPLRPARDAALSILQAAATNARNAMRRSPPPPTAPTVGDPSAPAVATAAP